MLTLMILNDAMRFHITRPFGSRENWVAYLLLIALLAFLLTLSYFEIQSK